MPLRAVRSYGVAGFKLDDLCGKAATPQPTGQNWSCPTCGSSNGDPHLRTVNRYKYDFQAAGEFVLLKSSDSSTEIQARQEPYHALSPIRSTASASTPPWPRSTTATR